VDPYAKLIEGRIIFGDNNEEMSRFLGTYDFTSLPFDWGNDYQNPEIP
jgi:isoamylase